MTLTANQQIVQDAYKKAFNRDASFGTLGGASYWTDQIANNDLDAAGLAAHLAASAEGQTAQKDSAGNVTSTWLGGVNPNASIAAQQHADAQQTDPMKKTWASHFSDGGSLSGDLTGTIWEGMAGAGTADNATTNNVAGLLNSTYNANNPDSTFPSPYYNNDPIVTTDQDTNTTNIPGNTGNTTTPGLDGWWNQFADADAFKDFLNGDQTQTQSGGMDDFMKFMMLMSVMGGGGQGGYGGGSQYGYGGLNPGGVQSAYNPLENLQGMGDWFKNNFGSGGGASTATVNAT